MGVVVGLLKADEKVGELQTPLHRQVGLREQRLQTRSHL